MYCYRVKLKDSYVYSDDGHSLDYKNGQYLLRDFQFADNQLTSR